MKTFLRALFFTCLAAAVVFVIADYQRKNPPLPEGVRPGSPEAISHTIKRREHAEYMKRKRAREKATMDDQRNEGSPKAVVAMLASIALAGRNIQPHRREILEGVSLRVRAQAENPQEFDLTEDDVRHLLQMEQAFYNLVTDQRFGLADPSEGPPQ